MENLKLNGFVNNPRLILSSKLVCYLDSTDRCFLDSILPFIQSPCLIKIDVDGGEVDILKGASGLLDLPKVYWIVETHSQQLEQSCVQMFTLHGYSITLVPQAWWRFFIPELRPSSHNRWLVAIKR